MSRHRVYLAFRGFLPSVSHQSFLSEQSIPMPHCCSSRFILNHYDDGFVLVARLMIHLPLMAEPSNDALLASHGPCPDQRLEFELRADFFFRDSALG